MAKSEGSNGGIFGQEDSRVGPGAHGKGDAHPKLTNENVFGENDSRTTPECKYPTAPAGEKQSNFR